MGIQPTKEQDRAVALFRQKQSLKIAAFAGAGKTSTLRLMAGSEPTWKGLYLSFNKNIAEEAKGRFPSNVKCSTVHSLAFRAVCDEYAVEIEENGEKRIRYPKLTRSLTPRQLSNITRYPSRSFDRAAVLGSDQQAHFVLRTLYRFCMSGDEHIGEHHVPYRRRGVELQVLAGHELRSWTRQQAEGIWKRMTDPRDDVIPLGFNGYLKLWALRKPKLKPRCRYVLMDEVQDTNNVVLSMLRDQQGLQIVYVGDRHQQIYDWRGAVNAMNKVTDCEETALTQSFRFGSEIASAATEVIGHLGEPLSIRGSPGIRSRISHNLNEKTRAILARTNAGVIAEALDAIYSRKKVYVIGGTDELKKFIRDVGALKRGREAKSPLLFGFHDWSEVVDASEREDGAHLWTYVQLVNKFGVEELGVAVSEVVQTESDAQVVISTTHRSKGREWDSVRLSSDFATTNPKAGESRADASARLFYVAMTRAKELLVVDKKTLEQFVDGTQVSEKAS